MSAPQIPEAAKKAAHDTYCSEPDCDHRYDEVLGNILAAALPHLRRAWMEELIAKLDTQIDMALLGGDEDDIAATEWQERALDWLRAELAEAGNGK